MGAKTAVVMVFAGCCTNVIFLELLVKSEPGSGNIITLAQFLFISLEGLVFTARLGTRSSVIPLREYVVLVVMFFVVNVANNLAFGYRIPMPLHMIFRSGGLMANLIMGWLVLGRHYSFTKCLAIAMITAGTFMATLTSADISTQEEDIGLPAYLTGISLLTFALFMSARMGIYQECLYIRHGKHAREALFYLHILSLPGFLLIYSSIAEHFAKFSTSTPLHLLSGLPVLARLPRMWLFLAANTLTQYVCISSVFSLTTHCSALVVTLILTIRKFVSLIFSVMYFGNPFTAAHWLAAALVFGGTLMFADVCGQLQQRWWRREGGKRD